ncbi:MAG: BON domain-containing protein [Actinobacteria bacterium]|nr:MAG: BON domain-containing protein [Actinomycetota bacterium]
MPSTPTEPDDYVIARVQEALAQELNELDVTVTLTAGGAFLTGTVTTKRRCKEITELVQRELPGVEVHNDVGVASLAEPDSAEELT